MGGNQAEAAGPLNCATLVEDGWFMEKNSQWPGQATALRVKEVLLHKRTDYQDLMVFESTDYGKVLVLDGVIQLTERDEMSYQEMMAHLPLFSHANPADVLILGGGDGGVLREVVKHECVQRVAQCEIDAGVIEASKQFFPTMSCAFGHPKASVMIGDGVVFAQKAKANSFDVIIIDSSDPVGPAEKLYSKEFYDNALRILKPGGVLCSQGECLWIDGDLIRTMVKDFGAPFASAEYATIQVPTYTSGQIGAFLARKAGGTGDAAAEASCRKPVRPVPPGMELSYYTAEMHAAAFALPAFLQRQLLQPGP